MSDPLPAAAIGLPEASTFDRRSFLATLAAAGVMAPSADLSAATAGEHPDGRLIAMVALFRASEARQHEYDRQVDEAYESVRHPPIPDALYKRENEPRYLCTTFERLDSVTIDGEERFFFSAGVADLTHGAQQYDRLGEAYSHAMFFGEAARARVREIKAAHAVWEAANRAAEEEAGVTRLQSIADAESAIMDALYSEIVTMRATTIEGIKAKARFALIYSLAADADDLEIDVLPKLLRHGTSSPQAAVDTSLLIDILRLDVGAFGEQVAA